MSQHDQLVANLARSLSDALSPCSYQGSTEQGRDETKIIQTHISSVILVGADAYKLKRDIKLPFLDFSTLQQRRRFCLLELQVNRRTAPQIYLEVVAVTGSVDHPAINGAGDVIDWAVHMRRFESGKLFSEMAEHANLTLQHVTDLAHHLATFHQGLTPLVASEVSHIKPTPEWLLGSLDEIEALCRDRANIGSEINQLRSISTAEWESCHGFRVTRVDQGFIRECHGDLHLANITFAGNEVVAFDAIEFEQDLRKIDLINEIAFTFMDLFAHGLPEHAWQFLNAYLQTTGDYDGLRQLVYFTRYRAIIRAKVALLGMHNEIEQDETQNQQKKILNEKFRRYWRIACTPPITTCSPSIYLVGGLSGSGKSTVAEILSRSLAAVWLRADVERKRLYPNPDPSIRYSADATKQTYEYLTSLAENLIQCGFNVVVDATFLNADQVEVFRERVADMRSKGISCKLHGIVCHASEQVLSQRIASRAVQGADPSEATLEVLAAQRQKLAVTPLHWPIPVEMIKNEGTLRDLENRVKLLKASFEGNFLE